MFLGEKLIFHQFLTLSIFIETRTYCTATTIESGKTIRSRIQQTGANSQLESCCFTYKLS